MTLTIEIPDELAGDLADHGKDPTRAVIEALALEGYRKDWFSEYQVQQLLGFETRMEVHGFLKENGVYLHYTMEDLEHDLQEAGRFIALMDANQPSERRVG